MSSVDVLVPCYRYGRFLHECVQSVLTQPIKDLRVLIIDDASPDNTAEVASDLRRHDSRVTVLWHPTNRGHISTYNEGIEWACADYTLLLSADDYLLPGALKRATDLMNAHPEVGFAFGKAIDVSANQMIRDTAATRAVAGVSGNNDSVVMTGAEFFELICSAGSVNIVRAPTAVVRTGLQKRLGGYRPELPHTGDLEMWLRLAAHAPVGVLAAYQAAYRVHESNMQQEYYQRGRLPDLQQRQAAFDSVLERGTGSLRDPAQLRRRLLRPLAYEAIECASGVFNNGHTDLAREIAAFAVSADPEIKRTMPWVKFAFKQRVGIGFWQVIRPAVTQVRRWAR